MVDRGAKHELPSRWRAIRGWRPHVRVGRTVDAADIVARRACEVELGLDLGPDVLRDPARAVHVAKRGRSWLAGRHSEMGLERKPVRVGGQAPAV